MTFSFENWKINTKILSILEGKKNEEIIKNFANFKSLCKWLWSSGEYKSFVFGMCILW